MFSYKAIDTARARVIFLAVVSGIVTSTGSAQTPMPAMRASQSCDEREAVGWLGISGLNCTNCVFTAPGRGEPILFSTEPRITAVASGSPASEVIREGDVLISVDGALITTHAGGTRFHNLKPGDDVTVVVRRNGEAHSYRLQDLPSICRTDRRVPGSQIPPGQYMSGSRALARGRGGAVASAMPRTPPPPPRPGQAPLATARIRSVPRASFGFSITCERNCVSLVDPDDGTVTWEFEQSPAVYSVDASSEAYRADIRRGDVITRIDGHPLTTREGGRRFGAVVPGQRVEFTLRRGSQTLTRFVQAERPAAANLAMLSRERETALDQAKRLTQELQQQERLQSAQLDRLRRTQDDQVRVVAEQLRRQQTEQSAQLTQLQAELARADREINASAATTRREVLRIDPRTNAVTTIPGDRTMRYVGRIGDIEIEVRGGSQVLVAENDNEYVITIGDSVIRLKKTVR